MIDSLLLMQLNGIRQISIASSNVTWEQLIFSIYSLISLKKKFRSGKLVLQSDFKRSVEGTWLSWGANLFIQKPAMYAYNSLLKGTEKIPSGSYIHQDIMEVFAKCLSVYCTCHVEFHSHFWRNFNL